MDIASGPNKMEPKANGSKKLDGHLIKYLASKGFSWVLLSLFPKAS